MNKNDFKARAKALVARMTTEEKISQMIYDAPAIKRLGISAYNWWNEGLHGVARSGVATVFPQAIGMAASFNPELMRRVGEVISDEARAKYNEYKKFGNTEIYQGLTYWSPNINIFRDPRWGRGQETFGEDPYLTGVMATEYVKGMQGEGKYRKVDATLKHYAVHSGPEAERHRYNAEVSEFDLYDTYLRAFKYCIEHADPSAVMGAYNRVGGEPCCASETLLRKILFGEFGFDGYVVSDCGAIRDIWKYHKYVDNPADAAALAVKNGCHLNCGKTYEALNMAVELGKLDMKYIDDAAERLMTARFRLGMFDNDCEYDNIPYDVVACDKHAEINLEMARQSIVLLKNDGILPLRPGTNVAIIGPNADSLKVLLGNYNGTPDKYYTFLRGIQETCRGRVIYAKGSPLYGEGYNVHHDEPLREALIAARRSDVVIMCCGITSELEGEQGDLKLNGHMGDRKDIELPELQKQLYRAVLAVGKPVVFVNASGSCVSLVEQNRDCSAVLQCFYPGAMGGRALADILFGRVSPSGRLPVTFYRSVDDLPPLDDYSMKNRTYRYYEGRPLYPFGHGLTYSDIEEKWVSDDTAIITNNGPYHTRYSVLRYVTKPAKTLVELKNIFIRAGESKTLEF